MKKETQNLIKLASSLEDKYLIKEATSDEQLKTFIVNHAKSSTRYIPFIGGVDFVTALEKINRNATLDIKYEPSFFGSATFEVTPFVFEEGTPEEEQAMFKAVPDGIKKFLKAQGSQFGTGKWRITFP